MIAGLPIAFGAPAILLGLLALPVIWWLLRLTPPRPQAEPFAPLAILALVLKNEETPSRSPWWLTALRLLIAALVILALAEPVLNPRDKALSVDGPLALIIDNGWASAPDWDTRTEAANILISEAEDLDIPVSIVFTADRRHDATPGTFERAREQLRAAKPRPLLPERGDAMSALIAALGQTRPGTVAFLTDGIDTDDATEALNQLAMLEPAAIRIIGADNAQALALTHADNGADALSISASRLDPSATENHRLTARDSKGREISSGTLSFEAGDNEATATISAPFEIRNDIARLDVTGIDTAGSVRLLDDSFRRRRVALVSGEAADVAQPLLSPLYYINRALSPYADLIEADSADMSAAIPKLLAQAPAVMVMADIGVLPDDVSKPLNDWIESGGTLIRFAGPRLAAAPADDPLSPVLLRKGERELGGALSWIEPQSLADYPATSPFAGLPTPRDVTVSRQVLAEPSADLAARTWTSLADGTPLVTAAERGAGRIVLFHVTAEAGWSNLPISGHFVDMLRRVVQLSRAVAGGGETGSGIPPPWRLLDANGTLIPASGDAKPLDLTAGAVAKVSGDNPPGLYGAEDGFVALNLFGQDDTLAAINIPEFEVPVTRVSLGRDSAVDFRPWLFGAALLALLIDTLIVLLLNGAFRRKGMRPAQAAAAFLFAVGVSLLLVSAPGSARAQDAQPGDAQLLESLDETRLAYVITGDEEADTTSRYGLDSLSRYLSSRTALEPGTAIGVDIETDQLALYPLIYWPMSEDAALPTPAAISRIDAYMKSGGTVLFDTRDRIIDLGGGSSLLTQKLQQILANLDIPPLEPVPSDHVLTKSFFLLDTFPGRYADGPLWVEATPDSDNPAERPARSGDGVSSILITGNDMAAAWAIDDGGYPMFSTVPADPWQREYAYRAGVNIVMYMLTGNYKADQVHIPALLERLGQ
ncbi:N-terminal double-transmembrane domain-containing protein [Hoeflea sp. IMCC20628]|uniref:DUF4159 domain-containing protein n=1 Tax=Hoeflea sp. IMCC20628 TaxID=1620421 RepID=UPI00063AF5E6|nr:DUF4159 domain-containing protein [Hoeflea sp. IMCC20628]AKH99382.1 N-terminal double-transmembrane domain-containing protein [Hoeflea sp. IMCC20628]